MLALRDKNPWGLFFTRTVEILFKNISFQQNSANTFLNVFKNKQDSSLPKSKLGSLMDTF